MAYSLSFTKGIFVVIFVADKIRQGQYEYLSTTSIANTLNIPKPTLVKILQSLHQAGIIQTKEGKHGGIRLMKRADEITIREIFLAIEKGKPLFQTSFDLLAKGKRPDNAQKLIETLFDKTEQQVEAELEKVTIASILDEMGK